MGQIRPLLSFIFGLFKQTIQFLRLNVRNVMSIQYIAPGFEPTTFQTESSPVTTRPGLPPYFKSLVKHLVRCNGARHDNAIFKSTNVLCIKLYLIGPIVAISVVGSVTR